jgi:hypothetical protein
MESRPSPLTEVNALEEIFSSNENVQKCNPRRFTGCVCEDIAS